MAGQKRNVVAGKGMRVAVTAPSRSKTLKVSVVRAKQDTSNKTPAGSTKALLSGISKTIRRPGLRRDAIFLVTNGKARKVFAYSVLPSDTSKIVREARDGSRAIGRFTNGRFRVVSVKHAQVT